MSKQYDLNCGLLRLFDDFDTHCDSEMPVFNYCFDEAELKILKEQYKLTQVADGTDDWSRVRQLLHWLYANTWYNGEVSLSMQQRNSIALLEYSFGKGQEGGINCYNLATILTELCLSIGIPARIVSIHPLNPHDMDNHVITVAWCRELEKWVSVDPSFNAYLSDEEGCVLSPWEVREFLCRNQKVNCNEELGYNNQEKDAHQYITYIAKDLFYMRSPITSRFGEVSRENCDWTVLIPKEFDVAKREACNNAWRNIQNNNSRNRLHYLTHSPVSFAQPPIYLQNKTSERL